MSHKYQFVSPDQRIEDLEMQVERLVDACQIAIVVIGEMHSALEPACLGGCPDLVAIQQLREAIASDSHA